MFDNLKSHNEILNFQTFSIIPFFASHEEVGDLRGSPASSWPTFLGRG